MFRHYTLIIGFGFVKRLRAKGYHIPINVFLRYH